MTWDRKFHALEVGTARSNSERGPAAAVFAHSPPGHLLRHVPAKGERLCDHFARVQVCALQMRPPNTQPLSSALFASVMVKEPL